MRKGFPQSDSDNRYAGTLQVDSALDASEMALWSINPVTHDLYLSDYFYQLLPELAQPLKQLDELLALMPGADSYIFQKSFGRHANECATQMQSCEVRLTGVVNAPRLRFIGRLVDCSAPYSEDSYLVVPVRQVFQGVVVSSQHWLANPGPDYVQHLLVGLFAESPIPSFLTDAQGVVLQQNQALEKLFNLTPRQASKAVGRYSLLRDKSLLADTSIFEKVQRVYQAGEVHSFEINYSLANLHKNKLLNDVALYMRVSLLPMRDRFGKVVRVLVQLQDFSREQDVSEALQRQDQLLYSVINNSQNLIAVKSVDGRYLLANRSFAQWLDRDAEEVCGLTDYDLFDTETAQRLSKQNDVVLRGDSFAETEDVLSGSAGAEARRFLSARFVVKDTADNIFGVGQVMTDISRQKAIEETLENQRQELHLLLDSMHAAIWYFDQWGRVKDANNLAFSLVDHASLNGKTFIELAGLWDDSAERQREIMQVIRTGEPQLKSIESATIAGNNRWFSVDKIPTHDKFGSVNGVLLMMTDITDELVKERALQESEARYRAFIANSSEAIWCYDMTPSVNTSDDLEVQVQAIAQGAHLSECNQVLARMMGAASIDQVVGSGLVESGSKNYLFDLHYFVEQQYRLIDHEIIRVDHKGRSLCFQISCMGVVENNRLIRVWGTTKDVTARKRYQDRLEYQSTHDSLTKLPNRIKLYKEMEQWLRHRSQDQLGALLLIDLDRFKEINDTLGHQVGDHLLQLIGPRLEIEMSEMPGVIARLGGDEFAIFLPQIRSPHQAVVFGHRVLDALRQEFDVDGFCTEISASMGISISPTQAQDVSTMMRYADVAMYRAKTEMSGLSLYNSEYDPHSPKRLAMMGEVGRAIREEQLCLYYQPKVSLITQQFYGFEALLRWIHPELGFVSPADFIPIVEMTSLIHPMTAWVLERSIAQCQGWHERGMHISVAVNLSARNLLDENIPKLVQRLLSEYQLPASALELEITESSIMTDPARAMRVLDNLHALGVQLSIDDFGTGYSSLAYLKRLPVKTLKIDNSFVRNMLEDKQDELIVNSTIHLAHNLGLIVVAEGVENEELLQRLQELGCDEAQGYHIGRPMPVDKVEDWLANSLWTKTLNPAADAPHT